ncbi:hypothetical protein KVR01_009435 [Diaporthe batatas]|uniref:uncharacterized protein n=1 Tax=Diaporthe batatas TaxID=748121 RepID=UPI001D046945|nr:uncharacterized protein KVR01_009435 [Diaporthe batatas]KAG8161171.1 hypothetical protein KVR01_009435 [Diaporthe batatas]
MSIFKYTPQTGGDRPTPRIEIGCKISRAAVPEAEGDWLFDLGISSFLDDTFVGLCHAKLVKESEYESRTKHFFSAMDDQSNTMGEPGPAGPLVRGAVGVSKVEGPWKGMKEYGDRMPAREQLDREARENGRSLSVRRHWLLLLTDITVAQGFRGCNIDGAMVRLALEKTMELARAARRPLLAAVEPGCVQLKHFYISDRPKFWERYGPFKALYFWLAMGFQRFEKPKLNTDLSNFFFWSGLFRLPEVSEINLDGVGERPGRHGCVVPDGHMIVPEKRDARCMFPRMYKAAHPEQREPEGGDKMELDGVGEDMADKRPGKHDRAEYDSSEASEDDQRAEERHRLVEDMNVEPAELPPSFQPIDQISDADFFNFINWPGSD